jgi:hypothetical protein
MALITTNASLLKQYTPFTGLSASERAASGIARAELIYYGDTDWNGPGTGNNRLFQVPQTTLPEDFGYVLTDAFISVTTDLPGYVSTEMTGQFRLFPGGVLGPEINLSLVANPSRMTDNAATAVGSIAANAFNTQYPSLRGLKGNINYALDKNFSGVIYPFNASSYTTDPKSIFDVGIGEETSNGPDYTVRSFIRFLQYDIDQSYNYVIQSPQLVR